MHFKSSTHIQYNTIQQIIRSFGDLEFVAFRNLGFIKFQLTIISLISFCNYSFFFISLEYRLDLKGV